MSKKDSAATYLKVSEIRERQKKMAFAKVQSERNQAQEQLDHVEDEQAAEMETIREQCTDTALSAASLSMMSEAVVAAGRKIDEATNHIESLKQPLEEARGELTKSATKRKVAEKFVERRRLQKLKALQKKQARQDDELASTRASNKKNN